MARPLAHKSKLVPGTVLVLTATALAFCTLACQSAAYPSYTYDFFLNDVPSPPAYRPSRVITGDDLGLGPLREPADLYVSSSGRIYLLDTGNNRVVYLSSDFDVLRVISSFDNDGHADGFNRPEGIFVTDSEDVYVADTGNARLVQLDSEGAFTRTIGAPSPDIKEILPSDFDYRPTRVGVDLARGQIYVVSKGAYDGILVFEITGEFTGFVGAPRVTPSAADLFWLRIATSEQRRRKSLFLPIEFASLDLDADGFVYSTVAGYAGSASIKRLTPAGRDVLRRTGFIDPIGDPLEGLDRSAFIDIAARRDGMYSVLDATAGRVFTYDYFGNLLYVFGAKGDREGLVQVPSAIDTYGDDVIVLDSSLARITVYCPTWYGALIHAATYAYNRGDFDRSTQYWRQVSQLNSNYDLAYWGIGKSYAMAGSYADAMRYFRLGNHRRDYSNAFADYREEFVRQHIGLIMAVLVAVAVIIFLVRRLQLVRRANEAVHKRLLGMREGTGSIAALVAGVALRICEYSRGVWYSLHVMFHPYDGFLDLKREKKGNVITATVLVILVTLTYVAARQYTGFIFNTVNLTELNIYVELFSVIVPLLLWCIINWAVTSVLEGKGSLREIYVMSAYALTPIIVVNIPLVILSNFMIADEGAFYYLFLTVSVIWAVALIFSGSLVIHEYTVGRTALTSVITLAGMGTVLFLGILQLTLANRVYAFIASIVAELFLRV